MSNAASLLLILSLLPGSWLLSPLCATFLVLHLTAVISGASSPPPQKHLFAWMANNWTSGSGSTTSSCVWIYEGWWRCWNPLTALLSTVISNCRSLFRTGRRRVVPHAPREMFLLIRRTYTDKCILSGILVGAWPWELDKNNNARPLRLHLGRDDQITPEPTWLDIITFVLNCRHLVASLMRIPDYGEALDRISTDTGQYVYT